MTALSIRSCVIGLVLICTPTYAQEPIYSEVFDAPYGRGSGNLQVADFNRDGNLDIFVDNFYTLIQYFGNGDGTFTEVSRIEHPDGRYLLTSTIADFNSDGFLDLIFSDEGRFGKEDGTFGPAQALNSRTRVCGSPHVIDHDNDGAADLLCFYNEFKDPGTSYDYGISVLKNYGNLDFRFDGTWLRSTDHESYRGSLLRGDLNNDTNDDFTIVNNATLPNTYGISHHNIGTFLGTGEGYQLGSEFRAYNFHDSENPWNTNGPGQAVLSDINNDANIDLVIAVTGTESAPAPFISIHYGDGAGNFSDRGITTSITSKGLNKLRSADMNADGFQDLIFAQSAYDSGPGLLVYLPGRGDGTFEAAVTLLPDRKNIQDVVIADFNNDGSPDIAASTGFWSYGRLIVASINTDIQRDGVCTYQSSDSDGDGWGWENGQSCEITDQSQSDGTAPLSSPNNIQHPLCASAASDLDGDGWGWENNKSCRVNSRDENVKATCSSASFDSDGDGWGWENGKSCVVQ